MSEHWTYPTTGGLIIISKLVFFKYFLFYFSPAFYLSQAATYQIRFTESYTKIDN